MPATLKQVAEHTNLSIPTVSEILNHKNRLYRSETRERVLEAARQLGYRPNVSARSIKSGRFDAVALLQSSQRVRNYLPNTLLNTISEALSEKDLLFTLASVSDEQLADPAFVPQILRILSVDGLLINYNAGFPERLNNLVHRHRIPSVWINAKPGEDCIYPNDHAAAKTATEYLINLGHRNIMFVDYRYGFHNNVPVHYSNYDRWYGYSEAMENAGLAPGEIRGEGEIPMAERCEFSRRWLVSSTRPTAILTYTEQTALPVLHAACLMGLEIPRDLSIITFNDHVTDEAGIPMDTMVLPEAQMGSQAVKWLLEKIEEPGKVFPATAVTLDFKTGWTTASAPAEVRKGGRSGGGKNGKSKPEKPPKATQSRPRAKV